MKVYRNARIVTLENRKVIENGALVEDGGLIKAVCAVDELKTACPGAQGAETVDCAGGVIMPGLINSHSHITFWRSFGGIGHARDAATEAFMAARNGLNCLRKGITAIRDMGHNDHVHNEMKKAVEAGIIMSPRMRCAVAIIAMAHGHAPNFCVGVTSPYDLVSEIHRQINAGTDFIKMVTSHDDLFHIRQEYCLPWCSQEFLTLAAETAHELYTKLSAHATGTESIRRALNAKFDCVEHGIGLTAELAAQMKEQGTFYVPTLTGYLENAREKWNRGPGWAEHYQKMWDWHQRGFVHAVEAGVKLVAGTDTLGDLNEEIALLYKFGLSRHEALEAATINAARLMDMDGRIGSLAEGKLADFIVLRDNPLDDLAALYTVNAVSLGGHFVPAAAIDAVVPASRIYIENW